MYVHMYKYIYINLGEQAEALIRRDVCSLGVFQEAHGPFFRQPALNGRKLLFFSKRLVQGTGGGGSL